MKKKLYDDQYNTERYQFNETPFKNLMQKRVTDVLLVSSKYDKFMLEEDGRIEEQIFQEYVSLNLRYPPKITQVSTASTAFKKLKTKYYDLVITMPNIRDTDPFELAKNIKKIYPKKPIVALIPFSREFNEKLLKEGRSSIDYIFSWLGHAELLMAIIKLVEDSMNVKYDTQKIGVSTIILVEDSIRFYSSYLPNIYKILIQQEQEFMSEALNEHKKTLRMRGRPKILLATNFEEAMELYEQNKEHVLGIVSDVTYRREGVIDKRAGLEFCLNIRKQNKHLPILLQSSQLDHKKDANVLNAGFIYKYSENLLHELKKYIIQNFGFGPFIIKDPSSGKILFAIKDLKTMQHQINHIPDKSMKYHISNNHFSLWFQARGLFSLSRLIRPKKLLDFPSIEAIKEYLRDTIRNYRLFKGRGTIANFDMDKFDGSLPFSRLGKGSLGGKARGLAFIDSFIKRRALRHKYEGITITIPKTVVLATDIFENFINENNLHDKVASENISDHEVLQSFLDAKFSDQVIAALRKIVDVFKRPLAVRSSSLLEDSHYQPFAGVYATYMLPNNEDIEKKLDDLIKAIKHVYASTYYKSSKNYMLATHNLIDEEKMAVVIQQVAGKSYSRYFYPSISGVARSLNFYTIENEKSEEGIVNMALGMGRTAVSGETSLRFSPKHTKKIMQLSTIDKILNTTQQFFYAIDLKPGSLNLDIDENTNLVKLPISQADSDNSLDHIASTFDMQNNIIRDSLYYDGRRVITFASILKYDSFPIPEIISDLLVIGSKEMNNPVEIEFAVNLKKNPITFNFLQIRPIVKNKNSEVIDNLNKYDDDECIIRSNKTLGNGLISDIKDIIYVKPTNFNPANNIIIKEKIKLCNDHLIKDNKNCILIGPGRWGSSDPWLGIPVKWTDISSAKVIIESSIQDYNIDASQGSHFFQNITSFGVFYMTINPHLNDGIYDIEFLNSCPAVYEDEFIRHVHLNHSVTVLSNGRDSQSLILKKEIN